MTTLFKRNSSGRSSPEERSLTSSPLKSSAAAASASSPLSPRRTPNTNNTITTPLSNSSPTKKSTSSSSSRGITIMKYIFLSILILLVYFLLKLNLNLIKRLEVQNNKQHTTTTANDGGGITAGTIDTAGNTRGNLSTEKGNLRTTTVDDNNDEDNMEMLQKRLVTLQNEVTNMQKKVEGARHKVDSIKKNGIAVAADAADSKNGAGKGIGVVSDTSSSQNKMKELPRHTCTSAETAKQTTRLQKRFSEWWSHSACPDQVWMEHIGVLFDEVTKFDSIHSRPQQQQQQQQQQPFLILDIGCNKGYTSADFFDTLSPGTNMNPKTLVGAIRSIASEDNIKIDRDGGVCNDSNKALNKDRDTVRDVEVHCFEPSPATYEMLNRAHVKLMPKNNNEEKKQSSSAVVGNNHVVNGMTVSGTKWYIHNKGLHNTNGKMMWHKACGTAIGDELCTIVDEGTEDAIVVPVVTVDKFMEETFTTVAAGGGDDEQLPLVHMLKIDAEGLDPAVLQGSTNLLTTNRAIMVMFEFNPGLSEKGDTPHGMWGKRGNPHVTLLDVTNWLDTLGYDCYLDTHLPDEREMNKGVLDAPALYRITGDCLNREPSVRGWANVVCAARKYGSVAERLLKLATIVKP